MYKVNYTYISRNKKVGRDITHVECNAYCNCEFKDIMNKLQNYHNTNFEDNIRINIEEVEKIHEDIIYIE